MPAAALLATTLLLAQPAAEAPDLNVLSWLQGRWRGSQGTLSFEEHWSLQGQALLGVARTLEGGKTTFIEVFALEPAAEGWVLRIRMFGPALDKALRGKDEPLRLKMVELDAQHVLYEGLGPEAGTRLLYRLESPGNLLAELSKTRNGKPWKETYRFTRDQ